MRTQPATRLAEQAGFFFFFLPPFSEPLRYIFFLFFFFLNFFFFFIPSSGGCLLFPSWLGGSQSQQPQAAARHRRVPPPPRSHRHRLPFPLSSAPPGLPALPCPALPCPAAPPASHRSPAAPRHGQELSPSGHGAAFHPQKYRNQQHHLRFLPYLLGHGEGRPGEGHPLLHRPQQEGEQELQQVQASGCPHQTGGQSGAAAHDGAGPLVPEPPHRVQRGRADGGEAKRRRVPGVRLERDRGVLHRGLRQGALGPAAGESRADRRPHAALLRLLPQPAQGVFPARQDALRERDETVAEGQQRQSRFAHQRDAARHLLQLQHRIQHRAAPPGLALRSLPFPDPGSTPLQPQHQPLLRGLLLHVHRLPLRRPGSGAQGFLGGSLLPGASTPTGHFLQQVPDVLRGGGRAGVPPCPGQHPGGHIHRAGGPQPRRAGGDQRAPADEPFHRQRQKGPQLQDVQHQRGALRVGRGQGRGGGRAPAAGASPTDAAGWRIRLGAGDPAGGKSGVAWASARPGKEPAGRSPSVEAEPTPRCAPREEAFVSWTGRPASSSLA